MSQCLIALAPAAAAGTLEARVMAHSQLPSQPHRDLGRLGARCCFNEKSGVGEWLWLRGGREGEGSVWLPSVHLSSPAAGHRPPWALVGAEDPKETKTAPPRGMLGRTCELGRGWGGTAVAGVRSCPTRTKGHSVQAGLGCPLHSLASVSPSQIARPPPALSENGQLWRASAPCPRCLHSTEPFSGATHPFQTRKQN